MSRATVMAALLGMGLAVPDSAATSAEGKTSAVIAPQPAPNGTPSVTGFAPGEPEEVMGALFSVERVDRGNRSLVVRSPDGSLTTITIAPTAGGLDVVGVGDRVVLDYYRSSVVSLALPRAVIGNDQAPTRANAPVLGAAGARQVTSQAHVTDVDSQSGTLQVTTVDGRPHTFVVQDPAARMRLRSLRDGDELTVTYTEAVAVGLHTQAGG